MVQAGGEMNSTITRRVWCETLSFSELLQNDAIELAAREGWSILLAVLPGDLELLPEVMLRAEAFGTPIALWPMLTSDKGRWAHATTMDPFLAFAEEVIRACEKRGRMPGEMVVDLEPPFFAMSELVSDLASPSFRLGSPFGHAKHLYSLARASTRSFDASKEKLRRFVNKTIGRGVRVSCTALPLVALDDSNASWQRVLGTPVDGVGFERVNIMMYTSLVEGWSRGVLTRARSVQAFNEVAECAVGKYGDRASLSLGLVGTGAFSDEPVYRSPLELEEDVALALGRGVRDLSLFDLGGVVRRPNRSEWTRAFNTSIERVVPHAPFTRVRETLKMTARLIGAAVARP